MRRLAVGILAHVGAGKTTLVKLLKGLLKPVSGSIYFHGEDISGKTVAMLAGNVGYVFQNPDDQIFKYNVMDEILFGPLNIGMDAERAKKEAERALKLTGLAPSRPYFIQFKMQADKRTFFRVLLEQERKPLDPMELVYPNEVPVFEKYDEYLPEELVKKGFACGVLSIDEMRERIRGWEMFA